MGGMPVGPTLQNLGPNEIYQFNNDGPVDEQPEPLCGHAVLFVGFGLEGSMLGPPYLVFMSSNGSGYAAGGFGKVYFDQVYQDRMYIMRVQEMARPCNQDNPGVSSSSSAAPAAALDDVQIQDDVASAAASDTDMDDDDETASMDSFTAELLAVVPHDDED